MPHGHFSEDARQYIITDPRTPRPWHNYLFNDEYLVNLTQLGTGASFYQPTGEGLRTNLTEDRDGNGGPRFVYLRDNDTGRHWTVTGAPDVGSVEQFQTVVGQGYQTMSSVKHDIAAQWTVFVPPGTDSCEYWQIKITNQSDKPRRISAFPYLEMHLTGGSTLMDFISVLAGRYDAENHCVFGINNCAKFPPKFKAFLASDRKPDAATISRDEFIGPYRDYHNPIAVTEGNVHNDQAGTEWLGASLRHDLQIAPGQTVSFNCLIGVIDSEMDGRMLIKTYLADGVPDQIFRQIQEQADQLINTTTVKTEDPQFDRWVNVWLKRQLYFVARWGRVIGRGYRDILQDSFGHRMTEPEKARQCLLEVFSKQFPSGKCIRAWRLPNQQLDLQHYADSPSWMIMALAYYLKETRDMDILNEDVPFLNPEDPYMPPTSSATLWEHVVIAQRHLLAERGRHGLSKIYYGDWCDTMNGVGRTGEGESVMLAMQVKWGCDLLAELARQIPNMELVEEMTKASAELAQAINEHAWDGKWYVRAFDDDGVAIGSDNLPETDDGELRIFLNPQSWALISEVADSQRADLAVEHAKKYLETGYGVTLNWPQSTFFKPRIGQMSAMTPGFYENGSVYVHGNCFWSAALAMNGRGEEAWQAIRTILPDLTDNKPNTDTEPFVIPNMYIGPVVKRRMQKNLYLSGWRTGSASWIYMTMIEGILGIRAEYEGLVIEPHLPNGWQHVEIKRLFRGDTFKITIDRPTGKGDTVKSVTVDGQPWTEPHLYGREDGSTYQVNVTLA